MVQLFSVVCPKLEIIFCSSVGQTLNSSEWGAKFSRYSKQKKIVLEYTILPSGIKLLSVNAFVQLSSWRAISVFFYNFFYWISRGWIWFVSRYLFRRAGVFFCSQLSYRDFLYLSDKEVPNMGNHWTHNYEDRYLRTHWCTMANMRLLEGRTGTCTALLLVLSWVTSGHRLYGPKVLCFALVQQLLSTTCLHVRNLQELFGFVDATRFKASEEMRRLLKNACVITGEWAQG